LIEFSTEAAIRLVHGLPISTGVIEAAIRETLEHCEQDAEVSVHLHPEDLKMLKSHQSELLRDSPHQRRVRYLEGKEVSRGGCLVETRCGVIDGRRETRAALLREAVSA
jgi:flagellar biosynthesis/type III secretory pathway protein FliH